MRLCILLTAATGCLFSELPAQEVRMGAHVSSTDHELLGDPTGLGMAVGLQINDRLGLRVGYERSSASFESVGSTCIGLVFPGQDCAAERRADDARMGAITLAVPIAVVRAERLTVSLVPGARDGWVSSNQEGQRTGRSRLAEKDMYGLELGGEVRVRPWGSIPIHMTIGGSLTSLHPWRSEFIADGYSPFERDVDLSRAEVTVSAVW